MNDACARLASASDLYLSLFIFSSFRVSSSRFAGDSDAGSEAGRPSEELSVTGQLLVSISLASLSRLPGGFFMPEKKNWAKRIES